MTAEKAAAGSHAEKIGRRSFLSRAGAGPIAAGVTALATGDNLSAQFDPSSNTYKTANGINLTFSSILSGFSSEMRKGGPKSTTGEAPPVAKTFDQVIRENPSMKPMADALISMVDNKLRPVIAEGKRTGKIPASQPDAPVFVAVAGVVPGMPQGVAVVIDCPNRRVTFFNQVYGSGKIQGLVVDRPDRVRNPATFMWDDVTDQKIFSAANAARLHAGTYSATGAGIVPKDVEHAAGLVEQHNKYAKEQSQGAARGTINPFGR